MADPGQQLLRRGIPMAGREGGRRQGLRRFGAPVRDLPVLLHYPRLLRLQQPVRGERCGVLGTAGNRADGAADGLRTYR